MTDFFDHLPECDLGGVAKSKPKITHACENCGGSGKALSKAYGRAMRQYKRTCPVCKGKGEFKTDAATRAYSRKKTAARKATARKTASTEFETANPGLRDFLMNATWSDFAQSLFSQLERKGTLSEKQTAAALSMQSKCAARQAERKAEREQASYAQMPNIRAMFDTASAKLNKPKFLLDRVSLRLASKYAKPANIGAIYVKIDGEYAGKIVGTDFMPTRTSHAEALELLSEVERDPQAAAKLYGDATGNCCCCGRMLTDQRSVSAGIGPICAGRYGFAY